MSDLNSPLAVLTGIVVRMAIPILMTALTVHFLRELDMRWQIEADNQPKPVEKPACWEITGCSPARREHCPGYFSSLPCWQARRMANGYLREECLSCKVFLMAPAPQPAQESGRRSQNVFPL